MNGTFIENCQESTNQDVSTRFLYALSDNDGDDKKEQ